MHIYTSKSSNLRLRITITIYNLQLGCGLWTQKTYFFKVEHTPCSRLPILCDAQP